MPPSFTRLLAERLDRLGPLPTTELTAAERLAPARVYLAAGDRHVLLQRRGADLWLTPDDGPPENSCRPAADVLFRSAAATSGSGVLGVVLTGMGSDGLRGSGDIRAAGGRVLVQDEQSSVVWGMPGCVARAGLADAALPLDGLANEITRRSAATRQRSAV